MPTCAYCGKSFTATRRDATYCSSKCRTYASRQRARAMKKSKSITLSIEGRAMVAAMRRVLPNTAARLEAFIQEHGVHCTESAVKLCLEAIAEYQLVQTGAQVDKMF